MLINENHPPWNLSFLLEQMDFHYSNSTCEDNEYVMKFWLLINNRTLDSVLSIWCGYTANTYDSEANRVIPLSTGTVAYINKEEIMYPCTAECKLNDCTTDTSETMFIVSRLNGCFKQTILLSHMMAFSLFIYFVSFML